MKTSKNTLKLVSVKDAQKRQINVPTLKELSSKFVNATNTVDGWQQDYPTMFTKAIDEPIEVTIGDKKVKKRGFANAFIYRRTAEGKWKLFVRVSARIEEALVETENGQISKEVFDTIFGQTLTYFERCSKCKSEIKIEKPSLRQLRKFIKSKNS